MRQILCDRCGQPAGPKYIEPLGSSSMDPIARRSVPAYGSIAWKENLDNGLGLEFKTTAQEMCKECFDAFKSWYHMTQR